MNVQIEESWKQHLAPEFEKDYFIRLTEIVRSEYQTATIYPPGRFIFNAFNLCPFDKVKVVIIGQDPYHGPGQAHGLCFSVNDGVPFPPSLQNIFKEIQSDLGAPIPTSGNLTRWANQGVLLLNATLTGRAHQAGSHQRRGWEEFTDAAIRVLAEQRENIVFILWGSYAISLCKYNKYILYNIRISKNFTERLRIRRLDIVDMSSELHEDYQNLLVYNIAI